MYKRVLNCSYRKHINFINLKRKNLFTLKKKITFKLKLRYYYKKLQQYFFKKFFSDYFFIFRKLEMFTGSDFKFRKISIWVKNKKKLNKKSFILLDCNFFDYADFFIDFFIINNSYANLNVFKNTKKKYFSLEQFFNKKFTKKVFFNSSFVYFDKIFFFETLSNPNIKRPVKFNLKKHFKKRKYLTLSFWVSANVPFFNLINLIMLNENKLLLFLYKYFRNKKIKI